MLGSGAAVVATRHTILRDFAGWFPDSDFIVADSGY